MNAARRSIAVALACWLAAGCGGDPAVRDGGEDASRVDGGRTDAAGLDAAGLDAAGFDAGTPPSVGCGPLPGPTGATVMVTPTQADMLPGIVRDAAAGTTILLADGTYRMTGGDEASRRIQIDTQGLTLRSASNDATAVVIDGQYGTNEMITIGADDVTVAHITVMHAIDHPIHVSPSASGDDVTGTLLYGLRIIDGGEQFVKINSNGGRDAYCDDGRIECSTFLMTDEGRTHVERGTGGCYTGGIDTHGGRGWVVRNNTFRDIYCAGEGLAEHAIHFWTGSRDTVVENNVIVNCARGIGFGLVESGEMRAYADDPYPGVGYVGHYDGIIRNNVVYADIDYFDTGIELAQARGARVIHNTVLSTAGAAFFSSIDYRYANTEVEIQNNLTRRITMRDGAGGTVDHNVETASLSDVVSAAGGDFHLAASATDCIDQGTTVTGPGVDIDGEPHSRGSAPDIGADER
jgi:hypothetical protein